MICIFNQLKSLDLIRFRFFLLLASSIFILPLAVLGQDETKQDTAKVQLNYNKKGDTFLADTVYAQKEALDIGSDRGLFILSPDKKMQMRILGSVRAAMNYSDQDLSNKNKLNPYEIPTNLSTLSPNYFASLSHTRIGFEVTRHTKKKGDVFIRIEADFASSSGNLRIRHAYGQFKHLIVGQTWSLFSNVNYTPATVSVDGAAGSIFIRTPQIRFFGNISSHFNWAAGIEYSLPDFIIPDSIQASILQVIPDLTAKVKFSSELFTGSIGGIVTSISGKDSTDKISYGFGVGGSVSGKFIIGEKNNIFFSVTGGQGITHFIAVFGGKRQDAAFNPNTGKFSFIPAASGYIGYERRFSEKLIANVSFGVATIYNKDFQDDDAYSQGYNALVNIFWTPVEGAKIGFEYGNGQRFDKGGNSGMANKISLLMYYDF